MPIFSYGKVFVLHFYFDSNKIGTLISKELLPEVNGQRSSENTHV